MSYASLPGMCIYIERVQNGTSKSFILSQLGLARAKEDRGPFYRDPGQPRRIGVRRRGASFVGSEQQAASALHRGETSTIVGLDVREQLLHELEIGQSRRLGRIRRSFGAPADLARGAQHVHPALEGRHARRGLDSLWCIKAFAEIVHRGAMGDRVLLPQLQIGPEPRLIGQCSKRLQVAAIGRRDQALDGLVVLLRELLKQLLCLFGGVLRVDKRNGARDVAKGVLAVQRFRDNGDG